MLGDFQWVVTEISEQLSSIFLKYMDQFFKQMRYPFQQYINKEARDEFHQNRMRFEESTSVLLAAGSESTMRLRSTTQPCRGVRMRF